MFLNDIYQRVSHSSVVISRGIARIYIVFLRKKLINKTENFPGNLHRVSTLQGIDRVISAASFL